ncbi:MAG: Na(+)/H(+) antiporter subunit D [Desulfobulbaceae bacterium]|jgi:multicomponent Na+:H+ antiporter subunit D|nr:Na(+)/H(+) antiporter subunit D [Desulfobulbaceae bacterium]MDH3783325.1 Na(+)/H(+) antiporter subunit D [Desulfobulbaceae bacterium]MDH3866179.1 Na(+)/H(+) antiporter subunit D [Desulfobulbaceae bacterium]HKJ13235.1 Na(+)/H(+) antiporter subunit D [Desulfobulbales bacterium]
MIEFIPPAFIYILGALLVPLLRGRVKSAYMLILPIISFFFLISTQVGTAWEIDFLGFDLVPFKVDRLSLVFGYIFHLISVIGIIYTLSIRSDLEYVAGLVYAGSALGVVFAGDLFTFFVFWEMLTVSALWLIWAKRTKASQAAGFRYLMVHVFGGLVLLAGIIMYISEQKSISLGFIGLHSPATYCIFIGMGINAAWPLLHTWLTDAYPESTVGGAVFLSAFTTKTAVYALARTFPGTEPLIWIGAVMTAFPIFFAVIENDMRRVLSYSLINQVGFMMVGIGIGTELSINGAAAHAFAHILYKSLLFMSMGAVIFRTGKINATDLGGLYKSMPWTALFCSIGAASISAFPLTSGFVSKSMVLDAAAHGHMSIIWLTLLFASAGVFHHSGIKIPFFAFFSHDAGHRVKEAPPSMLIAMGIAAFFCIFLGVYPKFLYSILPYPVDFVPYTAPHVLSQLQLLMFSALAFTLLLRSGIYPAEIRAINLDTDLIYRKGGRLFYQVMDKGLNAFNSAAEQVFVGKFLVHVTNHVKRLPATLLAKICWPFWKTAFDAPDRKTISENLLKRAQSGFYPIAIMGLFAAIYFSLLFLL